MREQSEKAPGAEEDFGAFMNRTAPTQDDIKENVFDKGAAESMGREAHYMSTHISIAPPEEKLEIKLRDTRMRPPPATLRPQALDVLDKQLRCLDRSGASGPPGHTSDFLSD